MINPRYQTAINQRHHEEEPQSTNSKKTSGIQLEYRNSPQQEGCNTAINPRHREKEQQNTNSHKTLGRPLE